MTYRSKKVFSPVEEAYNLLKLKEELGISQEDFIALTQLARVTYRDNLNRITVETTVFETALRAFSYGRMVK